MEGDRQLVGKVHLVARNHFGRRVALVRRFV